MRGLACTAVKRHEKWCVRPWPCHVARVFFWGWERLAPINYRKEVIKGIRWVPQFGWRWRCPPLSSSPLMRAGEAAGGHWAGSGRPLLVEALHAAAGPQPGRCRVTQMEVNFTHPRRNNAWSWRLLIWSRLKKVRVRRGRGWMPQP